MLSSIQNKRSYFILGLTTLSLAITILIKNTFERKW